ncbi:uncharacterized protein LOC130010276 [Patella vulgata]|uniref:uncharacterized protein LOC130010276 n=1 Tax=Patella vulgata TaxID=6465 RepID=UPI00217F481C|nr:uncharacterized protein LOC130010276 [Patella vulgata]
MAKGLLSSRCLPYRILELTLILCMCWVLFTTVCWTWFLWSNFKVPSPAHNIVTENPKSILEIQHVPSKVNRSNSQIPVYIVEEHHEVLPYWFGAAKRGLISKRGNTLVHIDAHPDSALSEHQDWIPPFRFPESEMEIFKMMQENDGFIMSSVISGLFKRWIFIWSSWDTDMFQEIGHYLKVVVELGRFTDAPPNSSFPFCRCIKTGMFKRNKECVHVSGYRGMNETAIEPSQCDIKFTYTMEELTEKEALERIEKGGWLSKDENIVLDIDEDFYGCEAAVQPLYDVEIFEEELNKIKEPLHYLFCPRNAIDERSFDKIFHFITSLVAKFTPSTKNEKQLRAERLQFIDKVSEEFLQNVKTMGVEGGMCSKIDITRTGYLRLLLLKLLKLSEKQIKALSEIGLCLVMTPNSVLYNPLYGMRTCDGYNRPGESMVFFHTPTIEEINQRTKDLKQIFSGIPDPKIVTICRSMRDGYTPRKFFHKIESDVLESLEQGYSRIHRDGIHYDSQLLGGRNGWPDRHKPL